VEAEQLILWIAVALVAWFMLGSLLGRWVMRRKVKSCVEQGGRLRVLTPSSALVEFSGVEGYEYIGIFVDWVPFENLINLPLRLITRPKPIAVVKVEPKSKIQGYVSLTARSRGEALRGAYDVRHRGVSRARLDRIVEAASKWGFEKVTIDVKPNITIITILRGDCADLLASVKGFVEEVVGEKGV